MSLSTEKTGLHILSAESVIAGDPTKASHLRVANDAEVLSLALEGINCIALDFPKFTDGRAFSQAHVLRRRVCNKIDKNQNKRTKKKKMKRKKKNQCFLSGFKESSLDCVIDFL